MPKTQNVKDVMIIIGGRRITGFDDDAVVDLTHVSDAVESTVGADGEVSLSVINDDRMECVISVKENSRGARILGELYSAQKMQRGNYPGLTFRYSNGNTGEKVSEQSAIFLAAPQMTVAKAAGARAWKLLLPHAGGSVIYTTNLV